MQRVRRPEMANRIQNVGAAGDDQTSQGKITLVLTSLANDAER
jgi:hypothetical protein